MPAVSELEGCVLGIIWRDGPVTAHAVRMELARSPNTLWSGSSGAVYPLVRRLATAGMVTARSEREGLRQRKLYRLTASGRRALSGWLGPRLNAAHTLAFFDPLATRSYFLGALDPRKRERFFSESDLILREQQLELHRMAVAEEDEWNRLILEGAAHMVKMRILWLRRAQKWQSRRQGTKPRQARAPAR